MSGLVYLVGAGPGDPGLLTLKGAQCLAEAQVVVYDYLANPEFLELAPPQAERMYVGKQGGHHARTQEQINQLLCDLAGEGKVVVRLKGGDPFVFGRGGEEASALARAGHAFQVVPGVTSAVAAPAYAGIPVTDRRCSTEVAFVTGHEDPDKPESTINWEALARLGTVVFLMGMGNLPAISQKLIRHGKDPQTPAACIRWGTTGRQRTVSAPLAELPRAVAEAGLKPPAITVVGAVAGLRDELSWFESLPLFGRRVLVTRARDQASRLSQALGRLGAQVIEVPTIAIFPPADPQPLKQAVARVEEYDWLLFTSANGVEHFFAALRQQGKDSRSLARARLAAIGPATAQALGRQGLRPEVTAKTFVAEGLLEALAEYPLAGSRVLLPRAAQAREILPQTLRSQGALVDVVPAYQSLPPQGASQLLARALDEGLEVITFTASSTVSNLWSLLDAAHRAQLISQAREGTITIAAIGPITADTARELGLTVHLCPESFTIPALVEALCSYVRPS